jgi:hypothetical protein
MSALVTVDIEFDKREAVVAALEEMGYKVQSSDPGELTVRGEGGVFTKKAEVLAAKGAPGQHKMYSDIGFDRNKSGKLRMIISDVDQYWMANPAANTHYGPAGAAKDGENRLKQLYGKHAVLQQAQSGRWNTAVTESDGDVVIQMRRFV